MGVIDESELLIIGLDASMFSADFFSSDSSISDFFGNMERGLTIEYSSCAVEKFFFMISAEKHFISRIKCLSVKWLYTCYENAHVASLKECNHTFASYFFRLSGPFLRIVENIKVSMHRFFL